jgi:hypothetical protein
VVIVLKEKLRVPVAGIPNYTKNHFIDKKSSSFNSLPSKYKRTKRERIGTTKSTISDFTTCIVFFQTSYESLRLQQAFFESYNLGVGYCRSLYAKGGVCILVREKLVCKN